MIRPETTRRQFLVGALGTIGLAACGRATTVAPPSPAPTSPFSPSPSPSPPPAPASGWRALAASGPPARKDATLTASLDGARLYLFGGRSDGTALGDLWEYDIARDAWRQISGDGPPARFGHNAGSLRSGLVVFGGQAGSTFFNDAWRFDATSDRWEQTSPTGTAPSRRYGASGSVVGDALVISHGFTFQGRFDDTFTFAESPMGRPPTWANSTPRGTKPVKRCLHRSAALASEPTLVLFGGQTDGTPFLGDTWFLDLEGGEWSQARGDGPPARNLHAMGAIGDRVYVFGGAGAGAKLDDTWVLNGTAWERVRTERAPSARAGLDAAVSDGVLYVFGGEGASGELADLWAFRP